jgi:hypothetical protein
MFLVEIEVEANATPGHGPHYCTVTEPEQQMACVGGGEEKEEEKTSTPP